MVLDRNAGRRRLGSPRSFSGESAKHAPGGRPERALARGLGAIAVACILVLGPSLRLQGNDAPAPAPRAGIALGPDLLVRTLRPGYVLHVSKDAEGTPANGLIVETPDGLLLLDTGWTEEHARLLLDWAPKALGRPVVGALLTHFHPDRSGGVAALQERGIPVSALDLTVPKVRESHPGVPLQVLFTAAARAYTDPRGFEAFYPGPGHTQDNIVVFFPKDRVLFGGCLIKAETAEGLGFVGDADRASWPTAVQAVRARYPRVDLLVPGHGEPGGPGAFAHTLDLLRRAP